MKLVLNVQQCNFEGGDRSHVASIQTAWRLPQRYTMS